MIRNINPFVAGYFLLYFLNLWLASTIPGFPLEEAIGILIVMGLGFSLLAHFTSRKANPLGDPKPARSKEGAVLAILAVYITLIIIAGNNAITWVLPSTWFDSETEMEVV